MGLYILLVLLFLNLIIATATFMRNPDKRVNQLFAGFVAVLCVWIFSNYVENEPRLIGFHASTFFLRLDFASAVIFFYYWFKFCASFTGNSLELAKHRWLNLLLLLLTIAFAIAPFVRECLVKNISFSDNVIHFGTGPLWVPYAFFLNLLMLGGLLVLAVGRYRAKKGGNEVLSNQISLMIVGSIFSLGIGLIVNLAQAVLPNLSLAVSRAALFSMFFLVAFTGYAMFRARFFDIRLALGRAISSLFAAAVFMSIFSYAAFRAVEYVFEKRIDGHLLVAFVVSSVLIAFLFEPIRKLIEKSAEKFLLKGLYKPEIILRQVTRILIEEVEVDPLIRKILTVLKSELHIDHSAMLLLGMDNLFEWKPLGFTETYPSEMTKSGIYEVLTDVPCIYDELPAGELKEFFSRYYIAATFPIKLKERTIAIFVLGHKLSGEPFSENDITFFELLSSEMAIGIQNAVSFSEIKRFNEELEERVTARTNALKKSQEEELEKAKEVVRLKDEFVFLASHELRTPITAIRGFLELTMDAKMKFPKDIQENLEAMTQASEHLNQLVNDLLEIARSEGGKMSIVVTPNQFEPLLKEVMHGLMPLAKEKNIQIQENISEIPLVMCDQVKLKEVLINLIGNAIKYNKPNGVINISAFRMPGEPFMVFELQDSGYGIPPDQQERIFQKFFRAGTPGTEEIMGTGLGLFITRMLVERMGGNISFTSVEQHGTTFTFTLPLEG